jgi:hypothetical protein
MAFKLSKAERTDREEKSRALNEAGQVLTDAIVAYNDAMTEAFTPVQEAQEAYNQAREAAITWAKNVAVRIEDEIAAKSERWLESDKGMNAQSFQGDYENFDIEEVEIVQPDELPSPDVLDPEDVLESLPEEVE